MAKSYFSDEELTYLKLLSDRFPNIAFASSEIINLQAILNLPKGTEHFVSDLHGEYDAFQHVVRNASGVIKTKIFNLFEMELTKKEREEFAFLIYYPKIILKKKQEEHKQLSDWYAVTLYRLIKLCKATASKYTRSKVRKALPKEFAYIIDELLNEQGANKHEYYNQIIRTIIDLNRADSFITEISYLIQHFCVDHLHILGDIFDRGSNPHLILDLLENHHSLDIQWGNHDILWMGAAAGSEACIANLLRIAFRYNNADTIEDGYGINLRPLWEFALKTYKDDPCSEFIPKESSNFTSESINNIAKVAKAITIIQLKVEAEIIKRRSAFNMNDRLVLENIDYEKAIYHYNKKDYQMSSCNFPTVNPKNPNALSEEEAVVIKKLKHAFGMNERLQRHVKFLYSKGSLYKVYNNNLLFHGCILLNDDGSLKSLKVQNESYKGKELLDKLDKIARQGYVCPDKKAKKYGEDVLWYLWTGMDSPLFGKQKMATFERLFIKEKETHQEIKNPYYHYRDNEQVCKKILEEFELDAENAHIINGHVPVKANAGESPVKGNGRVIVIDGGFSRPYHKVTGIAGYTLIANSHGLTLVQHQPFVSTSVAIEELHDLVSQRFILETSRQRIRVKDTDIGHMLQRQISALDKLLKAYSLGYLKERNY